MSERIRGSYDDELYKSTYTLLTLLYCGLDNAQLWVLGGLGLRVE